MDFTIEDNDWIVDGNTNRLNNELFGGLPISSQAELFRRRKRKRVKAISQRGSLRKGSPLILLQSDKSRESMSWKKHPSAITNMKKSKGKINRHPSKGAIGYANKQQKVDNSVKSELPREHSHLVGFSKKLKKEKRQKFHNKPSKSSTADLVAQGGSDSTNGRVLTSSKLCPDSLRGQSSIGNSSSSTQKQRKKRTKDCVKSKMCSDVLLDNALSTSKLSNSNLFPPLKVEKLKTVLKSAKFSDETNQKFQIKDRRKGTLILEKGKRKEFSDIVRERAKEKLKSARFRFINEKMYTETGKESLHLFKVDPESFEIYHDGFQAQVDKWPLNPVDVIITDISKMPKTLKIADFGCGIAKIAQAFPKRKVYSFDFISINDYVTSCDMANVPLAKESIDIVVFCLALMGTNLNDYLCEAHRVLKMGGHLKIAEVVSRMENPDTFIKDLEEFGFTLVGKNVTHKMFIFLDFKKTGKHKTKLPVIELKPCVYKKR